MRVPTLLCLLLILTACAAPASGVAGEPRVPTETPPKPVAQPTPAPALGSSVLLMQWNASQSRSEIRPVDPATGQDVPGYAPIVAGENSRFAGPQVFSADGKMLAAVESRGEDCEPFGGGTACRGRADALHLIDPQAWREVTATLPGTGWVAQVSFSPDGTRLALVHNHRGASTLMLVDTGTGKIVARRALDFRPSLMEHTRDGTTLVIYGVPVGSPPGISRPDPPRVLLADAASLEVRWEQPLAGITSGDWCLENCEASHEEQVFASWTPAVVLSRDGRRLYIVHADQASLTTVDFHARAVSSAEIRVAQSWYQRLLAHTAGVAEAKGPVEGAFKTAVLSPDGTRLYVLVRTRESTRDTQGAWQTAEESLGLQVVAVESGLIIARQGSEATRIRFTQDRANLLLSDWGGGWTEVLDANNLQRVALLKQWEVAAARRIDGQPILLASRPGEQKSTLALIDPRSFDVIRSWPVSGYAAWLAAPCRRPKAGMQLAQERGAAGTSNGTEAENRIGRGSSDFAQPFTTFAGRDFVRPMTILVSQRFLVDKPKVLVNVLAS